MATVLSVRGDLSVAICEPLPARVLSTAIDGRVDVMIIGVGGDWRPWLDVWSRVIAHRREARALLLLEPRSVSDPAELARPGIAGVMLRSAGESELLQAVDSVLRGREFVSPELGGQMIRALSRMGRTGGSNPVVGSISPRELEVLGLVAEGLSNRDIGSRLHISENTVKNHLRRIHYKLGVTSRTEAVARGLREGLLAVPGGVSPFRVGR